MSQGSAKKAFKLQPTWDEATAIQMDRLLNELVTKQTVKKTGTYQGTGAVQIVPLSELPNAPVLLGIQKTDGSAPYFTLMPLATASHITGWGKQSFTLAASSSLNTVGSTYIYLVIA